MKRLTILCAILALSLVAQRAEANVIKTFTGTTPDTSVEVSFTADFNITGDTLTLVLSNVSFSLDPASPSLNPNDLLTSYYFSINGDPVLVYVSATTGDVFLTDKDAADVAQPLITNMKAVLAGDDTWQFRQGLDLLAGTSVLTYGVGTAGNATFGPVLPVTCVTPPCANGFQGNIVDGFDYGLYAGDVTTNNLDNILLVNGSITFVFSGLTGFDEDDIGTVSLFGLGTNPDSTGITNGPQTEIPEPASVLLLGMGLAGLRYAGRRSKRNV